MYLKYLPSYAAKKDEEDIFKILQLRLPIATKNMETMLLLTSSTDKKMCRILPYYY